MYISITWNKKGEFWKIFNVMCDIIYDYNKQLWNYLKKVKVYYIYYNII